jgi:hypothetical protein
MPRHLPDADGIGVAGHSRQSTPGQGLPRRRSIPGTNGPMPVSGAPPKPPALCMLHEDLAADEPEPVFGQYPRALIGKLLPWLGCRRHEILHVCSGALARGEGIRVDIRPAACPDILADGRRLPLADGSVAAAMLDPPYTEQYARDLYGVAYPRPSHLLREASRVVRPSGVIAFVHHIVPPPPPACEFVKVLGLSTGFGFAMRAVTLYRKRQADLPDIARSSRGTGGGR